MKNYTARTLFAVVLALGFAARSNAGDTPLLWTNVGSFGSVTFTNGTQNAGAIYSDGNGHFGVVASGTVPGSFGALTATTFNGNTLTTGTFTLTGGAGALINFPANFTGPALATHNYNNFATAGQQPSAATRTVITGSGLTIPAGALQVGTIIHWQFDMTKTGAGSASSTIDIAFGTAGTTSDTAQVSFTKPAGTAAADEGTVIIEAIVKTNSASGVVLGNFTMTHNLASTGHMTIPVASVETTSSTDNTPTPTNIELCITTGASDVITINQCSVYALNL